MHGTPGDVAHSLVGSREGLCHWNEKLSFTHIRTHTHSYENLVVELERSAQRSNPEVVVCTRQSRLKKPIAQLQFITRELNILSESQGCSSDDEDCLDSVPNTCDYYQFPDKYEYAIQNVSSDVIEGGSGSGSGDDSERGNAEDDACVEDVEEPEVTPTIIIGPDTTDMDVTELVGGNNTDTVGSGAGESSSTTLLTLTLVVIGLFCVSR